MKMNPPKYFLIVNIFVTVQPLLAATLGEMGLVYFTYFLTRQKHVFKCYESLSSSHSYL